jgi:hypothetical protein
MSKCRYRGNNERYSRMKKWILAIVLFLLIPTGCNFPLLYPQGSMATSSNNPANIDTLTTTPTAPIVSVQPTETLTPTLEISTATPTQTCTPTITVTPSDPAQAFGQPIWNNPLDNGQSFGLGSSGYDDEYTSIYIAAGKMMLTSHLISPGWKGWRLTDRYLANYYLEGTFLTSNCNGLDSYGLIFRAPDYSSGYGYYFGISCDGRYSLLRWDSAGSTHLVPWTNNSEIKDGSNQSNRIGVTVNGANYSLYVNGQKIQDVSDGEFMTQTKIGVFIAAFNTPDFTVAMDQINMWAIP